MARHTSPEAGQLRRTVTTWPEYPVPLPPMAGPVYDVQVVDDVPTRPNIPYTGPAPALVAVRRPQVARGVQLPDEWALRELSRLDLEDPTTYATLWETYGPLVEHSLGYSLWPLMPPQTRALTPENVIAMYEAQSRVSLWAVERGRPNEFVISVAQLRQYFELLRALEAHVWALQKKKPLARAWKSVTALDMRVDTAADARRVFQDVLNAALRPFGVRVGEPVLEQDPPPLYAVAALQIFNIYAEGLPILTCANDNCQRWFQRQLGRAVKNQYRTSGVLFCTHECADAQRQRDRRRQKRKGRS